MKKISRNHLKYIFSASICFFSLFALMSAVVAWFCQNRRVGSEQTVSGNNRDIHAGFFLYKFTKDYNGDATDTDEETLEKFDLKNFKLNTYDTIFVYQNDYTPAILRMHLYGSDVPTATAQDPKTVSVEITRDVSKVDNDPLDPTDITTTKFISSGANFALGMLADYPSYTQNNDLDDIADISDFMQDADLYFKTGIANSTIPAASFVVIDAVNGNSKLNSITLTFQYTSVETINGVNHLNVLLFMDYNEDLIEKFTGTENLEVATGLGGNDVRLENDLKDLIIQVN